MSISLIWMRWVFAFSCWVPARNVVQATRSWPISGCLTGSHQLGRWMAWFLHFLGVFQTCYSFTILTLCQTGRILQTELKSVLFCRKVSEFSIWVLRPKWEVVAMTWPSLLASSGMLWSLSCFGYLHNRICFRCHVFAGMGIQAGKVFDGSHQWVAVLFCPLLWCFDACRHLTWERLRSTWNWFGVEMATTTVDIFWIKASQLIPLALYSDWHVLYTKGFGRFGQGQKQYSWRSFSRLSLHRRKVKIWWSCGVRFMMSRCKSAVIETVRGPSDESNSVLSPMKSCRPGLAEIAELKKTCKFSKISYCVDFSGKPCW